MNIFKKLLISFGIGLTLLSPVYAQEKLLECMTSEYIVDDAASNGAYMYDQISKEDAPKAQDILISQGAMNASAKGMWDEAEFYYIEAQTKDGTPENERVIVVVLYKDGCHVTMFQQTRGEIDNLLKLLRGQEVKS